MHPAETEPADEFKVVSEEVVHAACGELGQTDPALITLLTDRMREIANDYLTNLSIEPYWGNPKAQRASLRKLADALLRALCRMEEVAPEYAVELKRSNVSSDRSKSLFGETQDNMIALANAICAFDRNYEPKRGKPTNIPLETAVRDLIELIEPMTGSFPKNAMGKHSDGNPKLKSKEALAIGKLLRGADEQLSETTIVNMIEKIARQPRPTEDHFPALFRTDPNFELNCSLLRDRDERD